MTNRPPGKYFGDTSPLWHGDSAQLIYPGTQDGHPIRIPHGTNIPPLKEHEFKKLPVVYDFKTAVFNSWDPESFKVYQDLIDRIGNGQFGLVRRKEREAEGPNGEKGWLFYIEWAQPYGSLPPSQQGRG